MIHKHNETTPLGQKRRAVYYPPDGSGRDNYIRSDNGGTNINYRCQGVPQLGNYMKFGQTTRTFRPASYTRFQKYASDGTGRDKYVVSHHGGQYNQQQQNSALLVKFRSTMRDGGWKKPNQSLYGQFLRPSQIRDIKQKKKNQSVSSNRLSQPKRKCSKYVQKLDEMRQTFYPSK